MLWNNNSKFVMIFFQGKGKICDFSFSFGDVKLTKYSEWTDMTWLDLGNVHCQIQCLFHDPHPFPKSWSLKIIHNSCIDPPLRKKPIYILSALYTYRTIYNIISLYLDFFQQKKSFHKTIKQALEHKERDERKIRQKTNKQKKPNKNKTQSKASLALCHENTQHLLIDNL